MKFAKKFVKKPASWWRKVLFSDEKKYYIFSLKRTQWCLPDEEPKPQPTFAVPPQVYVWVASRTPGARHFTASAAV